VKERRGAAADVTCVCLSTSEVDSAVEYAEGHLQLIGSSDVTWISDYVCPATGVQWRTSYPQSELHGGGPPLLRRVPSDDRLASEERVVISKVIHEQDRRPIYVYRSAPQAPDDSGWTATAGETHDLDASELASAHMSHLVERWPELAEVFADARDQSHWEWDEATRGYREILPPGTTTLR
jgi:hypothetical protein